MLDNDSNNIFMFFFQKCYVCTIKNSVVSKWVSVFIIISFHHAVYCFLMYSSFATA